MSLTSEVLVEQLSACVSRVLNARHNGVNLSRPRHGRRSDPAARRPSALRVFGKRCTFGGLDTPRRDLMMSGIHPQL